MKIDLQTISDRYRWIGKVIPCSLNFSQKRCWFTQLKWVVPVGPQPHIAQVLSCDCEDKPACHVAGLYSLPVSVKDHAVVPHRKIGWKQGHIRRKGCYLLVSRYVSMARRTVRLRHTENIDRSCGIISNLLSCVSGAESNHTSTGKPLLFG